MKTAEEWIEYHRVETPYRAITVADIQQIQLDAIKEGMTRVTKLITTLPLNLTTDQRAGVKQAILNIRDKLKEI